MHDADYWIAALGLKRHPEGGYYRETYRSEARVPKAQLPGDFSGDRTFATSILFLLEGDDFSALHRIKQDELWYFHAGSALAIHVIDPAGRSSCLTLGLDPGRGQQPHAVVRARSLFGAALRERNSFALVSCVCAPGFDFEDFEMPARPALLALFPQHAALIERLTR